MMDAAETSSGWRRPPLLHVLPVTLAGVIVLAAGFVFADWNSSGTSESLDVWLIRQTRVDAQPDRIPGPPIVQEMLRDLTALGGYAVLILVSVLFAGFALAELGRREFWFFSGVVWTGYFVVMLMKRSFLRVRPDIVPHLSLARGATSFPSAHAMMSVIVYVSIGLMLSSRTQDRQLRIWLTVSPLLLAAVVGATRVCMGVHYPTDVLAGWAAGLLWTWIWFAGRAGLNRNAAPAVFTAVESAETGGEKL